MKLSIREPQKLKAHPMNPKLHTDEQIAHICASIERFGFTQPVVIDENDTILVGHARTKAAISLGLQEIPVCRKEGLRESEKLALCLADNHIAAQTEMDLLKVQSILTDLAEHHYDVVDLGLAMDIAIPELVGENEFKEKIEQIKQIVIVLKNGDYNIAMAQFDKIHAAKKLHDNTDTFVYLLNEYEKRLDEFEADEDFEY